MELLMLGFFVLTNAICGLGKPGGRIVDGITADYGEASYAVSLRYNNYHECGGSIIGETWVLTAAHCIYIDFVNVSTVLYGTKGIQNGEYVEGHTIKVRKAYPNSNYQAYGGYLNDIALVELEKPFIFNMNSNAVKLPEQSGKPPVLQDSLLVGWGYNHVNGTVATFLQKVHITIYPDETCIGFFNVSYSPVSHICAGGGGKGQCTGDSGGALTVEGIQYGIVSWSDKPCATTPGVFTRVSSFRDWIKDISGI